MILGRAESSQVVKSQDQSVSTAFHTKGKSNRACAYSETRTGVQKKGTRRTMMSTDFREVRFPAKRCCRGLSEMKLK